MLVIQLTSVPPPTPAPGQHRDRPVPRREQAVVEVELREGVQFVGAASSRSSTNGPASSTTTDRPAAARPAADDPAARPGPDDDGVRVQRDRHLRGRPSRRAVASGRCRWARSRSAARRSVPEAHEAAGSDRPRRGPHRRGRSGACGTLRTPSGAGPSRDAAQPSRYRSRAAWRHSRNARAPPPRARLTSGRSMSPQDHPDLGDLLRVRGANEGLCREPGSPDGVATDERLGEVGQRRELAVGPVARGAPPA